MVTFLVGYWGIYEGGMDPDKNSSSRGVYSITLIPWVPHSAKAEVGADHPVTLMSAKYRSVPILNPSPKQFSCTSLTQGWSNTAQPVSVANTFKYGDALNSFYLQPKVHRS